MVCSQPLDKTISWKNIGGLKSAVTSIRYRHVGVQKETSLPKSLLQLMCFDFFEGCSDSAISMALPTVTNQHSCLCMWMLTHSPSHHQVALTCSVAGDLLRGQENLLICAYIPTPHRNNLFSDKIRWRWGPFFGSSPRKVSSQLDITS